MSIDFKRFKKGDTIGGGNYIFRNYTQRFLPDDYQEVEYIETTGTQYIDTTLSVQDGYKIICSASFANGSNKNLSGIQTGGGAKRAFGPWAASQTSSLFSLGIGVGGAVNTDKLYTIDQRYTFEANLDAINPYLKIDGVSAVFTASPGGALSSAIPNGNIFLFALNNNGTVATQFVGKVYGNVKLYVGNILKRDFIPCYRKSDNEIGLFDIVNQIFYTNTGTGIFIKGSNV